jgi:hypothetical protein
VKRDSVISIVHIAIWICATWVPVARTMKAWPFKSGQYKEVPTAAKYLVWNEVHDNRKWVFYYDKSNIG